jgi:TRAP-type C4-dicarboxylate transport system permease small subunit
MKAVVDSGPLADPDHAGERLPAAPLAGPLARLATLVEWLALALFVAMMLVALFQVVSRYAFIPAIWTEELARILFVASSLLGIAVCVARREHIIVDYFLDRMPPARRETVLALFDVLVLVFLLVWLRGALRLHALNATTVYVTVPWFKVSWIFAIEIASILLMILFILADLGERWRKRRSKPR